MRTAYVSEIDSFEFSNEQVKQLTLTLPRAVAADKKAAFVASVQVEVKMWLTGEAPDKKASPKDFKNSLTKLMRAAKTLEVELSSIPDDVGAAIHAQIVDRLWCKDEEHQLLADKLKLIEIRDPLDDENGLLSDLLKLVSDVADDMSRNIALKRGANTEPLISLVANLAGLFKKFIEAEPKAHKNNSTNFQQFLKQLGDFIGYDIGYETTVQALKRRADVLMSFNKQ